MLRMTLPLVLVALLWAIGVPGFADDRPTIAGYPPEEAWRLGERIYREGLLPSGAPVQAIVQGDISVDGRMFTCQSCHRRSGLGASEGAVVVPPIHGPSLYRARTRWDPWKRYRSSEAGHPGARPVPPAFLGPDLRPAYTDETLARALRTGVDAADRPLDAIMPRYSLNDRDMALLLSYLKQLSLELSPGVTDSTLRFATVVSEGVAQQDRDAMLAVLEAYINDRNAQPRHQEQRAQKGGFIDKGKNVAYRRLTLTRWALQGPRDTWRSQLEAYYRQEPVFALLGGMVGGDWTPMHAFCEQHELPCLFPITDRPVISAANWHTLYFSKGLYQEGEAAARYLRGLPALTPEARMVQVYRSGSEGGVVAQGFQETWAQFGRAAPEVRRLQADAAVTDQLWEELAEPQRPTVLLFWVGKGDLASLARLAETPYRPALVFISSSLLEDDVACLPDRVRDFVYITSPYSLPEEKGHSLAGLEKWLQIKHIPATNLRIQSKMYFLGRMLTSALMEIQSEFYRDYFLEAFDMLPDQTQAIAVYPRLSFGPGQRYAAKGGYIVQLTTGPHPALVTRSEWVTH